LSACDHSPLWFTRGLFCRGAANFPNQSGILSRLKIEKAVILPELVLITGLIPYFKMGKAIRFRVADVATAIERMRIG
jgi:hypothetical protein